MKPKICVLRTGGTNCDEETAYAFEVAGGAPERVHVNELRSGAKKLSDFQLLCIPGGFSYGDHIASGKILATELITFFSDELKEFVSKGKPILGICNGLQVLVRTGLLPFGKLGKMRANLLHNMSGRFECRWVRLRIEKTDCVFTRDMPEFIELPVANGEGRVWAEAENLDLLDKANLVVSRYVSDQELFWTNSYPANPSTSLHGIAGIQDASGRIMALMPHPERFLDPLSHPNWRRNGNSVPYGLKIFQNGVRAAAEL